MKTSRKQHREIRVTAWIQNFLKPPKTKAGRGEGETEAGPGLPIGMGEDQLGPGRDRGNMMEDNKESIQDMMLKDQRPTE
jgi:hypothetical protein